MSVWNDVPPKKRKPFFFEVDIPRDKAAVVARLDAMKNDGWRALESMSIEELNALQEEAESAAYYTDEYGFVGGDYEHDRTILEAREAIKDQRYKIRQAKSDRYLEQAQNYNAIVAAAHHIREAANLVESARNIKGARAFWLGKLPTTREAIDPSSMTESDLNGVIRLSESDLYRAPIPDHQLFSMLNTPAAEAIATELKEYNAMYRDRVELARTNRMAARKELDRRKAEAEAMAVREQGLNKNIKTALIELQDRIEELEASR